MKYIGRGVIKGLQIGLISFMSVSILTACGKEYTFPYDANSSISSFAIKQTSITSDASDTFASDYCITDTEVPGSVEMESDHYYAAGLFDLQKKEGFYKNISDLKKEFNLKIDNLLKFQRENEEKLENQITSILTKQNDLYEKYTNLKVKNDSINEMNAFKNKAEGDIFTHSVKIEQLSKDIMNMMYTYDKIYLDNFNFPGLIGNDGCRFQNFREYVKYQISKTDSFLKEKTNQDEVIQNLNLKMASAKKKIAKAKLIGVIYIDIGITPKIPKAFTVKGIRVPIQNKYDCLEKNPEFLIEYLTR